MNYVLCRKNIHMKIAPEKSFKCSKCGESVGVTKATLKQIENIEEKLKPICLECYNKNVSPDDIMQPLTKDQIDELKEFERKKR